MFKRAYVIAKKLYAVFPVMNRPMALCAVVSSVCIFCVCKHNVSFNFLMIAVLLSIIYAIIIKNIKLTVILIFATAVLVSLINEISVINDLEYIDGETVTADFIVIEDPDIYDKYSFVTVYCYNADYMPENTRFNMMVSSNDEIVCGDRFSATVRLERIKDTDNKNYYFGNSVYMKCSLIRIREYYNPSRLFTLIGSMRRYSVNTVSKYFDGDIAGLLIALNCGDKSYLSNGFYNKSIVCGCVHIMVVSGLHISIILGSVFKFFEKFFYNRYLKALCSISVIFLLCGFCGFTLSVIRAGFMFVFSALSPVFKRTSDSLNSLGIAVTVMLILSPFCIFSVSFLLSVFSTVSVVWVSPFFCDYIVNRLKIENIVFKTVLSVIMISFFAMLFTAPISIKVFGEISFLSPIVFLMITFPVTFALQFNTAALAVSSIGFISFLAKPLFALSGLCAGYIHMIIDLFGNFTNLVADAEDSDIFFFAAAIFAVIILMCFLKRKESKSGGDSFAGNI